MKKFIMIFLFIFFHSCASEEEACYRDLNRPGLDDTANSCENFIGYKFGATLIPNSLALNTGANLNFVLCAVYIQKEKECKKKSKILPRWYIRS